MLLAYMELLVIWLLNVLAIYTYIEAHVQVHTLACSKQDSQGHVVHTSVVTFFYANGAALQPQISVDS